MIPSPQEQRDAKDNMLTLVDPQPRCSLPSFVSADSSSEVGIQISSPLFYLSYSVLNLFNPIIFITLPAGFEALELLDKEALQNLGTLVEGGLAWVVVSAVVKDFGHVCYKLCQLHVGPFQ